MADFYQPNLGERHAPASFTFTDEQWGNGLLLRSTNWLGDVVMTLPAAWQLKQCLPAGKDYVVLCRRGLGDIWRATGWVDDVVEFDGTRPARALLREVRARGLGVGVVLPNSFGSALDLWRAGVPHRVGRDGRGRGALLTHGLPTWPRGEADGYHHVRRYLEIAASCGAPGWGTDYPALQAPATELPELAGDKPLLALAPGAAYGPAKCWPAAHFREVAEWWCGRGGRVVAIGAVGDVPAATAAVDGIAGAVSLAGKTSLRQVMGILARARAAVVNDSGAMHLAAALGIDGVAVFGSTDPVATGPVGAGRWAVLVKPPACAPCFARTCPRTVGAYECLTQIPAAAAIAAIEQLEEPTE